MEAPISCRYVFVDVAGTLVEMPGLATAIAGVLVQRGIAVDAAQVARRHKLVSELTEFPDETNRQFYGSFNRQLLLALGVAPDDALVEAIYQACGKLSWQPAPGAETLARLGQPVGVVSNWHAGLAAWLERTITVPLFRVIDSATAGCRKPDQRIFELAMAGLDCPAGEIAFVGDSVQLDMVPAAAVGMATVLYDPLSLFAAYQGRRIRSLDQLGAMLVMPSPGA